MNIKVGENWAGHDQSSDAIAHFHEEDNALGFKRQLEAQGETVRVERSTLQGFFHVPKEAWFEDYDLPLPREFSIFGLLTPACSRRPSLVTNGVTHLSKTSLLFLVRAAPLLFR